MTNSTIENILNKGKIFLKLTSKKTLALNDVLYVSSFCRNLVSGSLLMKAGLKIIFMENMIVISRNGEFVRKWYLVNSLSIINTIPKMMNAVTSSSVYIAKSINLWYNLWDLVLLSVWST